MPRAHGRIIDGAGNGVPGTCYFYKALDHEPKDWRAMVDTTGRPVTGTILGRPLVYVAAKADAVPAPDRKGFFDVPGGLPSGTYWIDFHPAGDAAQQRWAWPFVVTDGTVPMDVRIGGPSTGVPGGQPDPTLARQFTPGTFTASCSLYGLLGAPLDRAKRDLSRFRTAGFGNARVWVDWPEDRSPGCRALDEDGNFIEDVARKLDELMLYGLSIGMSFDLTMRAAAYKAVKKSAEGYDISAHKRAVRNVLTRWGQQTPFRILDMANEAEVRGAGGHGSPDTGHVSPGRFKELMDVARSVPRKCLVSCSVSGSVEGFPDDYLGPGPKGLFRDVRGEILLPHFGRSPGWGSREGANATALAKAIPGLPLHHQEPARNGHSTQPGMWPLGEFEQSFKTAKAAGSVGCCLHGDYGFDMTTKDAWDQLDEVERQVVASLKSWLA